MEYIEEDLSQAEKLVLQAAKRDVRSLRCVVNGLEHNMVLVKHLVGISVEVLGMLPKRMQDNKGVVLAAVSSNGYSLQFASQNLRADKEVVLAAVKENAFAIKFAAENLLSDDGIIAEVAKNNTSALIYLASVSGVSNIGVGVGQKQIPKLK